MAHAQYQSRSSSRLTCWIGLLLHAWTPSNHVWSNLSPFPHLRNQEPPGAQQLNFPSFVPQLGQATNLISRKVVGDFCALTVSTLSLIPARQWPRSEQIKYRIPGCSKAGDSSMASVPPGPFDPNPDDGEMIPVMSHLVNCDFVTSTTSCSGVAYWNRTLSPTEMVRRCPACLSLKSHEMSWIVVDAVAQANRIDTEQVTHETGVKYEHTCTAVRYWSKPYMKRNEIQ